MEHWKDIPGYEGLYQASSEGRVRSLDRTILRIGGLPQNYKTKILKPLIDRSGYLAVVLCNQGQRQRILVHRIVATVFIPIVNGKNHVNHIDCIKSNNAVTNLEWVNHTENVRHAFLSGRYDRSGEKHPGAFMTEDKVRQIRSRSGRTVDIAKDFGLSASHVRAIRTKKIWSHV